MEYISGDISRLSMEEAVGKALFLGMLMGQLTAMSVISLCRSIWLVCTLLFMNSYLRGFRNPCTMESINSYLFLVIVLCYSHDKHILN